LHFEIYKRIGSIVEMKEYFGLIAFLLLLIGASIIAGIYNSIKKRKKIRKKIIESWGKVPKEKYRAGDFDSIASYYQNKRSLEENKFIIDDITWNDLDMEKVFIRLNGTHSSVGEEYLYCMMREPSFDQSVLRERGRVIKLFQEDAESRKKLQYLLELLGKERNANISNFMTDFSYMELSYAFVYKILALLPIASVLLCLFAPKVGFIVLLASFITNMLIYLKMKENIKAQIFSISYAARMISIAAKITDLDIGGMDAYKNSIRKSLRKLKGIGRRMYFLMDTSGDYFVEYLKMIFLLELLSYNRILEILKKNREEYRNLYETIGFLDSMLSIASYRESLDYYTEPVFVKNTVPGGNMIRAKELYHPLIENPVSNSIDIRRSILVTGSNASGKSTFLKTLAINSVFAQTIYTCLAREYSTVLIFTMTSMALRDSIENNESYFIAEIKSLKRIFSMINDEVPCICFIDEILRGTNTIERIAASSRVLLDLSTRNCICMAATHDIELTSILESIYDNYHFREEITDNDVVFDYKLYKGKSRTKNALKLLKLMGFDNSIVAKAEKAAHDFEMKGMWAPIQENAKE